MKTSMVTSNWRNSQKLKFVWLLSANCILFSLLKKIFLNTSKNGIMVTTRARKNSKFLCSTNSPLSYTGVKQLSRQISWTVLKKKSRCRQHFIPFPHKIEHDIGGDKMEFLRQWCQPLCRMTEVTRMTVEFDIDQFNDYTKKLVSPLNALHEIKLTVTFSAFSFCFFSTVQISNKLQPWKEYNQSTFKLQLNEQRWELPA